MIRTKAMRYHEPGPLATQLLVSYFDLAVISQQP